MTCGSCKHEDVRDEQPCTGCSHGRWWEPKEDKIIGPLKAMVKCKYERDSEIEQYTPACCVEDGSPTTAVHPIDITEWIYCPYCSKEIQAYIGGKKESHR